jgi:hypothetical protein
VWVWLFIQNNGPDLVCLRYAAAVEHETVIPPRQAVSLLATFAEVAGLAQDPLGWFLRSPLSATETGQASGWCTASPAPREEVERVLDDVNGHRACLDQESPIPMDYCR